METLVDGNHVYITQEHAAIVSTKQTSTAVVCCLVDIFYTKTEQSLMNLMGANNRRRMHPIILSSILSKDFFLSLSFC